MARLLPLALVAAALAASAAPARPPGCVHDVSLGRIAFVRGGALVVYDFESCRERTVVAHGASGPVRFASDGSLRWGAHARQAGGLRSPDGRRLVVVRGAWRAAHGSQAIWVLDASTRRGRAVYRLSERAGSPGPVELWGWSPDARYLLFAIDPLGSASLAADGLRLRVLDVRSGDVHAIATQLGYDDYRSWCGTKELVLVAGGDRIATHAKRLVLAGAPNWRPHVVWADARRSFGSVACAPDGESAAVLSQRAGDDSAHTRWELWRIVLANRSRRLLDRPPAGWADESPRWSKDERALLFVRERGDRGELMLRRTSGGGGPLVALGSASGFHGHRDWWASASWTAGS